LRASDRMRERVATRLTQGCAEGYLSADTLSVRLDAALSARSDVELERLVIGRGPSRNFILERPTVSRLHAELRLHRGTWLLTDLGSRNGTWVNGWRVEQARLRRGDVVSFGDYRASFG
jgi:predicted component of type VI protein secretion system